MDLKLGHPSELFRRFLKPWMAGRTSTISNSVSSGGGQRMYIPYKLPVDASVVGPGSTLQVALL